jgi:hypothetical protein
LVYCGEILKAFIDGGFHLFRREQLDRAALVFDLLPDQFDAVELRAIGWQKVVAQALFFQQFPIKR